MIARNNTNEYLCSYALRMWRNYRYGWCPWLRPKPSWGYLLR